MTLEPEATIPTPLFEALVQVAEDAARKAPGWQRSVRRAVRLLRRCELVEAGGRKFVAESAEVPAW